MKSIIIANWKMNLGPGESRQLARDYAKNLKVSEDAGIVICPSASALSSVAEEISQSQIALGAQDCFWEDSGAFTGSESPKHLAEIGCRYVIIGHSEMRQYSGETDDMVHKKIKAALAAGLIPILCVGENYEERSTGMADNVILRQTVKALSGIDLVPSQQIIVAYEPVWVIGSGRPIEPAEAEHMLKVIRQSVLDLWPSAVVEHNVRFVYGGSIDSETCADYIKLDVLSGFLVGGASLDVVSFAAIIEQIK